MSKLFFLFIVATLFGCSSVNFDHPMPSAGKKLEDLTDLSGTYSFSDSTIKIKDAIFYNSNYYKDDYKKRDSIILVSGIIYFESQRMGYKFHAKAYYNMKKVDTARIAAAHKNATKSIEENYMVLDENFSDILIDISKQDQIKEYHGSYYLNKYKKENQWEVYQISVKEEFIYLGITNNKDKTELRDYTLSSSASNSMVHLEDDIFSKFIASGGFHNRIKFKKHGTSH